MVWAFTSWEALMLKPKPNPLVFALLALAPACAGTVETGSTGASPVSPPDTTVSHCGLGTGNGAVLALVRGADLLFVRDDGSSFVAATFPTKGGTGVPSIQIAAGGGFVAAIGFTWGGEGAHGNAFLLDGAGHVLYAEGDTKGGPDTVFVSALGDAVFGDSSSGKTVLVHTDGSYESAIGIPMGPPNAEGRFPAAIEEGSGPYAYGWAGAGKPFVPIRFGATGSSPMVAGNQLVYVGLDQGKTVLVRETSGGAVTFPFSEAEAGVAAGASDGWALVQGGVGGSTSWTSAPGSGATRVSALAGQEPFGFSGFRGGMSLGGAPGETLFIGRDSSRGGLFRSVDAGATWKPVGPTFSAIRTLGAEASGGTYVISASNELGYFETSPWAKPASPSDAPDHEGPAVFLVRPADGVTRELPASDTVTLDAAGLCAAIVEKNGSVKSLDVLSGDTKTIVDHDATGVAAWVR
jgi:hypothetical protein